MASKHKDGKDAGEVVSITAKRKGKTGDIVRAREILEIIESVGFKMRFNEVLDCLEVNGKPVTDCVAAEIIDDIRVIGEEEEIKVLTNCFWVKNAIKTVEVHKNYNPFLDYFQQAHYKFIDKTKENPQYSPIKMLSGLIKSKQPEEATKEGVDWQYVCLKYWLCGAIAKVKYGHQNWMLVLQGEQGVGKSFLARTLGRAIGKEYFMAGPIDPKNKDHIIKRSNTFVWEAEELDGTMNYADVAHIKAFLTQDTSKERAPYGYYAKNYRNYCSFIGTVNNNEFLKDSTGNRRFLCLEIEDMAIKMIEQMDIEELWGEADYILENELLCGDKHIELPAFMKTVQTATNERARVESALDVLVDSKIEKTGTLGLSNAQLVAMLTENHFQATLWPVLKQIMKRRGYESGVFYEGKKSKRGFLKCKFSY